MNNDDVTLALTAWVLGMCYEHNRKMGIFSKFETDYGSRCAAWVDRCYETAHAAVFRDVQPNGMHSDFECELMLKAQRLFQPLLKTDSVEV